MKVNQPGYRHAMSLIRQGKVNRDASWSFSAADGNAILGDPPDWGAYGDWHLAEDPGASEKTKERYRYPFGKGGEVYRSALTAIRQRAGQQKENDIFAAAGRLLETVDGKEKQAAKLELLGAAHQLPDPPERFQVFPAGQVMIENEDPVLMDEEGAALVLAHFGSLSHDMVIDYEHQTLAGAKAPAAGWVKELEWRGAEGLWARADWTSEASAYIGRREYRYFSPVFFYRKSDRRIVGLYNIALTNQPRMMNVRALAAKYQPLTTTEGEDAMINKLKKLLGLAASAKDEEVEQAVVALIAKRASLEAAAGKIVASKEVLEALGAKADATGAEVLAIVTGLKAPGDAAKQLSLEVVQLKKEIAELKQQDLVALALKEGKTSPEELDKWGRDLALKSPEQFKLIVLSRPAGSVVPLERLRIGDPPGGRQGEIGDATLMVAKMMRVSKEDIEKYGR